MDLIRRYRTSKGDWQYTLSEALPTGQVSSVARPPRFSFEDKYAAYRRQAKYPASASNVTSTQ